MFVPNAENAVVDIRKIRDYCLNLNNEVGKHKARVFASALNLTGKDATILQAALLKAGALQYAIHRHRRRYRHPRYWPARTRPRHWH